MADRARNDIFLWVIHGSKGDVVDLRIDLAPAQEAEVIELAKHANSRERHLQSTYTAENLNRIRTLTCGVDGT
jgi:hypothetical protein